MIVFPISLIRKHSRTLLSCLVLFFAIWPGRRCMAQAPGERHEKVTLDLHHATMDTVLMFVEQQTGYRFYYDTLDLDTNRIDITVNQEPFTRVLSRIFTGTDLTWSVDKYGHIF